MNRAGLAFLATLLVAALAPVRSPAADGAPADDGIVPDTASCERILEDSPQEWLEADAGDCTACVLSHGAIWTNCRRQATFGSLAGNAKLLAAFRELDARAGEMADRVTELGGQQTGGNGYHGDGQVARMHFEERLADLAELLRTGRGHETSPAIAARVNSLRRRIERRLGEPSPEELAGPAGNDSTNWGPVWRDNATPVLAWLRLELAHSPLVSGHDRGSQELLVIFGEWVDERLLSPRKLRSMRNG